MTRVQASAGVVLALAACGPRLPPGAVGEERFLVTLDGQFTTRQTSGPPAPVPPPFQESWRLDLAITPLETHPDDSLTRRWSVVSAVDGAGQPLPLAGRVFDVRQFASGELLQIAHVERALGPGYGMEAWDLLFFAVSPKVPAVGRAAVRSSTGWTTPFGLGRSQRLVHTATWARAPVAAGDAPGSIAVTWADPVAIEGRGTDRGVQPPPTVEWVGQGGDGRVVLRREDGALYAHHLRIARAGTVRFPGAPGGTVELVQEQVLDIRVERR